MFGLLSKSIFTSYVEFWVIKYIMIEWCTKYLALLYIISLVGIHLVQQLMRLPGWYMTC